MRDRGVEQSFRSKLDLKGVELVDTLVCYEHLSKGFIAVGTPVRLLHILDMSVLSD